MRFFAFCAPKVTKSKARAPVPVLLLLLSLCIGVPRLAAQTQGSQVNYDRLKSMSLEELLDMKVTSVSGYAEELKDAASAIQVVTGDEIGRSTATTIAEALRLANNLNIAQKNPHDWAVSARGFNANVGNKLLVLMDGRSVYTPLFAGVFWNAQDYVLEDIDQIEVVSGPGGTLWGANAVNGVINIKTKSAADTQGMLVDLGWGTETDALVNLRYGGMIAPNIYFRIYGKYLAEDDSVLANGARGSDSWRQGQGGFRIDAKLAGDDHLTVQGDAYSGDLGIQTGDTARLAGGNVLGHWTRTQADGSETSVQAYVDRTHVAVPFAATPFAPAGFLKDDLDTYDFSFRHTMRAGGTHRITAGFEYRLTHDDVKQQAPNVAYLPSRVNQSLPSVFVQDDINLRDDLTFTIGSKFEHNDYTGFEFEPSARLRWKPVADQTWWAAVSRAVRMPSRFDRDLHEPAPPLTLIEGGQNFASETVVAYETGYRGQWTSKFSTSVSVFYNDYDHLRSWGLTPVTVLPIVFENNLDAKTYGFEFDADWQVATWCRLNAGYSLLHERVRVKPGYFDFQNALDETADPEHQWSIHSSMDLPGDIDLDTAFRWIDSLRNNNGGTPGSVPGYAELDVHLGWHITRNCEIALSGRNLLHDHHPEYGPPGPSREELQRRVLAKVSWRY